jgi:N,N'-diacetylbacillosaminyl-diphospho-undecaprenol alpha-1,3-N-acetylgalactosaminyltransferase
MKESLNKKILIVCPLDLTVIIICRGFIETLIKNGYSVSVISSLDKYRNAISKLNINHYEVEMKRFISPIDDIKYLIKLRSIIKLEKPHAIFNFTLKPIVFGSIASLGFESKVINAYRGLGRSFSVENTFRVKILQFILLNLFRLSNYIASDVWMTNSGDLNFFLNNRIVNKDKVVLTKNGTNISYFTMPDDRDNIRVSYLEEFGFSPNDKVIIMVARIVATKGVREFIQTARYYKSVNPAYKFLLVGPVEEENMDAISPQELLRENAENSSFEWIGFRKDLKDIYCAVDLAVLPSYYGEGGYPRALMEPMSMGIPVVTTDTSGCRGAIDHKKSGLLIPPKSHKALGEAIDQILQNKEILKSYGAAARLKVENDFNELKIAQNVINKCLTT